MKRFLKRLLARREVRIVVVRRDPCRLTLAEWRSQTGMVKAAQLMLANADLRAMLDVLMNASPAHDVYAPDLPADVRSVILARAEGYLLALNDLESLGRFQKPAEPLEETFEPPEPETDSA